MGADLYTIKKNPKTWGFERSQRAVNDGYFRDAYNDGSILQKYGLSWWADIIPLTDDKGVMSVEKVKKFLTWLEERALDFEKNIASEPKEEQEYFREGAVLLGQFLRDAIELNSPIIASL